MVPQTPDEPYAARSADLEPVFLDVVLQLGKLFGGVIVRALAFQANGSRHLRQYAELEDGRVEHQVLYLLEDVDVDIPLLEFLVASHNEPVDGQAAFAAEALQLRPHDVCTDRRQVLPSVKHMVVYGYDDFGQALDGDSFHRFHLRLGGSHSLEQFQTDVQRVEQLFRLAYLAFELADVRAACPLVLQFAYLFQREAHLLQLLDGVQLLHLRNGVVSVASPFVHLVGDEQPHAFVVAQCLYRHFAETREFSNGQSSFHGI